MGGLLSGGHNREHDYTGRYKQLDSFSFRARLPERRGVECSIRWTDGGSIGVIIYADRLEVGYSAGDERIHDTVSFDTVPNNYGGPDRLYFLCPCCGRRSRILYMHRRHFKCRLCAGLNYTSQQLTKNESIPAYKMRKLLKDKFGVKESTSPYDAMRFWPDRPKGMHQQTYIRLSHELLRLKEQYHREFMRACARITR